MTAAARLSLCTVCRAAYRLQHVSSCCVSGLTRLSFILQIDGGQVVHPIYLTTERVTFTAPRNKVDTSYDSRDGTAFPTVSDTHHSREKARCAEWLEFLVDGRYVCTCAWNPTLGVLCACGRRLPPYTKEYKPTSTAPGRRHH